MSHAPPAPVRRRVGRCALGVFALALLALAPTIDDFGLTWDEPTYHHLQDVTFAWWGQLARARDAAEVDRLTSARTLLRSWPFARNGVTFHPPLASQVGLATHVLTRRALGDLPSRRLAPVLLDAIAITALYTALARRSGHAIGLVAAGCLLLTPRVYGEAHVGVTDTLAMAVWGLAMLAFWRSLEPGAGTRWRAATGVLIGLAFLAKTTALLVLLPISAWLVCAQLPRSIRSRAAWIDGLTTCGAIGVPGALAFVEIRRLAALLPPPGSTDLTRHRPATELGGWVLLVPLTAWIGRRMLARWRRGDAIWGVERPALETVAATLALGPAVGLIGNPAWWRDSFVRLAHYYALNADRRAAIADIPILYRGTVYLYSLPWEHAFVLIAITLPVGVLIAAAVGLVRAGVVARRDPFPLFVAANALTLPLIGLLPTPAHDGVRLLLPAFLPIAALAGWGAMAVADAMSRAWKVRQGAARVVVALAVLGDAGAAVVRIHPFELSYYNPLIGGPAGAWRRGFELTYWYDALDPTALADLNRRLPRGATVDFLYETSAPIMAVTDLQRLGRLRSDLTLEYRHQGEFASSWRAAGTPPPPFPYLWLLTHDSQSTPFTRILYQLEPWYARAPRQLDGTRVLTVASPPSVARAWALWLLATSPDAGPPETRRGSRVAPVAKADETIFTWARDDPSGLRAAARGAGDVARLRRVIDRFYDGRAAETLLLSSPDSLREAVEIVIRRPEQVRRAIERPWYFDPRAMGGPLDRDP